MERIDISHDGPGSGFRIEGYPDAVKVIALKGPDASKLSALTLHHRDLTFCLECLDRLALGQDDLIQAALWEITILTFIKCFQNSNSRKPLEREDIYKKQRDRLGMLYICKKHPQQASRA